MTNSIRIALVSDYVFPKVGGVESHIFMLGQALIARGHKVVLITHAYPPHRTGIRWMSRGLKAYYLPLPTIPPHTIQATLPALFLALPYLRQIYLRERIDLVHAHVAFSSLGIEAILHARAMGLRAVFTDHSLQGFGGAGELWGNKMLKAGLADIDAVIAVSHTAKENTVLRAALDPLQVYVIPNAVVASTFAPVRPPLPTEDQLTVICLSRLVYRKGIDLLVACIPLICQADPNVRFIVAGDGPKGIELEQMRERHQSLLGDRVSLVGAIKGGPDVAALLRQGHVFLNASLTEAFGIGLLEAAAAGLLVVSTRVGGVPEVLPPDLLRLAEPDGADLARQTLVALQDIRAGRHAPLEAHDRVKELYSWTNVAERVERVYQVALDTPRPSLVERFRRYYGCGLYFGKILVMVAAWNLLFLGFLDWFQPRKEIDIAPDFDAKRFDEICALERDKTLEDSR